MEPFTISLYEVRLTVYPQEDGVYKVFKGSNPLADLYPEVTEKGIEWGTGDWIDQDYVDKIGKLIEAYEHVPLH